MCKRFFLVFAVLILLSSISFAEMFTFSHPQQVKTYRDYLPFTIKGSSLVSLDINGRTFEVEGGIFKGAAVLAPGKNLLMIKGFDKEGNSETRYIKIIRLVTFDDIANHWAVNEIVTLSTLGIIEGYPDNNYYPQASLTRGELATWLARVNNLKLASLEADPFSDVPKEHWRALYIAAAAKADYIKAKENDIFGVDDPISRAEAIAIAAKAEVIKEAETSLGGFGDVSYSHPYYHDIREAMMKNLAIGISKKFPIFDPDREITRAEAAILFYLFKRYLFLRDWLFDFDQGYKDKECKINTGPKIKSFDISPDQIIRYAETTLILTAEVFDYEGLEDISSVRADLSSIEGPPDAEMFDNGKEGDPVEKDGRYTLIFKTAPELDGYFKITAYATDRYSWRGEKVKVLQILKSLKEIQ